MVAEFNSIQIITNNRVTAMKGSTVHKSKHQKWGAIIKLYFFRKK